jgi:hypothetical protein
MEPNTNNVNMGAPMQAPMPAPKPASSGAIWAIVIILAVILAGGAYFWGERSVGTDESIDAINQQSDSDSTADIEADLKATDVDNVDYDLDESNFNAS